MSKYSRNHLSDQQHNYLIDQPRLLGSCLPMSNCILNPGFALNSTESPGHRSKEPVTVTVGFGFGFTVILWYRSLAYSQSGVVRAR